MKRLLLGMLACALGVALHAQTASVSYDTFMRLDVTARRAQFPRLAPSTQADLLREQVVRWRRVQATRLTPEQTHLVAVLATNIEPEFFGPSSLANAHNKATYAALQQRAASVFPPEDLPNLFTVYGPYLPLQP